MRNTVVVLFMLLSCYSLSAQQKMQKVEVKTEVTKGSEPGTQKVRIEKTVDGKTTVTEKIIKSDAGINEMEIIDNAHDSLIINPRQRTRVIIKDKDEDFTWKSDGGNYSRRDNSARRSGNYGEMFDRMTDGSHQIRIMKFDERGDKMDKDSNKSIRSLKVYTNKPQTEVLNVSFHTEQESDVMISVIDTKGNSVAKETVKNFKGEYVGQINLKKNTKGVFFVIVAQGNDGQSKKIVVE